VKLVGLTAHGFDISSREIILSHDELFEIDIVCKRHSRSVELEDVSLGFGIGKRELW